jgi:hypothetical protein
VTASLPHGNFQKSIFIYPSFESFFNRLDTNAREGNGPDGGFCCRLGYIFLLVFVGAGFIDFCLSLSCFMLLCLVQTFIFYTALLVCCFPFHSTIYGDDDRGGLHYYRCVLMRRM